VETAQVDLEIFKIKYADVNDIVSVLDRIFSSQRGTSGAASIPAASTRRAARGRQTPAAPAGEGRGSTAETIMIPDERSNSIIVFASRRDIEFIREIIAMLDVNIYVTQKTYIYYVENANAGELASLLGQIYTDSGSTARRAAPARPGAPGAAGGTSIGAGAAGVEGEVRIVRRRTDNALIIVTAPANYPFVEETIKRLDILPKQVMIDMLIVDMDVRDKSELGIQWTLRSQGDVKIGDDTYYFDGTAKQNASLPSDIGFSYTLFEASRFASFLRAYTQQSKLEVLSNPQITVANNMEAKIDIGNEIPIVTAESTVDTTVTTTGVAATYNRTIQYRATGILLTVTPHINEKRFVNLEVSQEVSNVSASVIAGIDSPVIETRKASTTVVVRDGETLVIGGMMRKSKSPTQTGIPILSKIPIIGRLFGSSTHQEEQTELLIFITPRVIANPEEGAALSLSLKDRLSISHEYSGDSLLLEY